MLNRLNNQINFNFFLHKNQIYSKRVRQDYI